MDSPIPETMRDVCGWLVQEAEAQTAAGILELLNHSKFEIDPNVFYITAMAIGVQRAVFAMASFLPDEHQEQFFRAMTNIRVEAVTRYRTMWVHVFDQWQADQERHNSKGGE